MRGKRSSPKGRMVCGVCLAWLSDNGLADRVGVESTAIPCERYPVGAFLFTDTNCISCSGDLVS